MRLIGGQLVPQPPLQGEWQWFKGHNRRQADPKPSKARISEHTNSAVHQLSSFGPYARRFTLRSTAVPAYDQKSILASERCAMRVCVIPWSNPRFEFEPG